MKISLLPGLLAALAVAFACSSANATIVIDDFARPNQQIRISADADFGPSFVIQSAPPPTYVFSGTVPTPFGEIISAPDGFFPGVLLGQERDARLQMNTAEGTSSFGTNGFLSNMNGAGSTLLLQYDGVDATTGGPSFTNGLGLNIDLTEGLFNNAFVFTGVSSDHPSEFSITVYTALTSVTRTFTVGPTPLPAMPLGPTPVVTYYFGFNQFGSFDFTQVRGIDLKIVTVSSGDVGIASFEVSSVSESLLPPVLPEPASMVVWSVLGLGGLGMGYFRRRKLEA